MKTIWKTALSLKTVQAIDVPSGAEFLCVMMQHGQLCIWYLCDPSSPVSPRKIAVVGTGHEAPETGRYIGSVQQNGGNYIWHVFCEE